MKFYSYPRAGSPKASNDPSRSDLPSNDSCPMLPLTGDFVMRIALVALASGLALGGCARSEAVRTSANTMIIQTGAAPICGGTGALKVSQQLAAIETIKAGYDRYIITGGHA